MANYSENDANVARRIVLGLFNGELGNRDIGENLSVADLEGDTAEFMDDLQILGEINANVPAIRIGEGNGELVPIALRYFLGTDNSSTLRFPLFRNRRYYAREFWYDWLYSVENMIAENNTILSREEARSTFERLATDFLATRIAGINSLGDDRNSFVKPSFLNVFQRKKGSKVSTPGCIFSVSSNSPGLRVFWSGGYCISPKYFGSPTSPAISTLQSGTYVFGVDGGAYGSTIQWDTNALISLPGNPNVHLNF
jgi:hypothetical protein